MSFARVLTNGVVADTPENFQRVELILQRIVDNAGDTIQVTMAAQEPVKVAYIIPTEALRMLLDPGNLESPVFQ